MPALLKSQINFLINAANAARAANHIWPNYAACETALESNWGTSRLALLANNLFGQKQSHPPLDNTQTLTLPTKEFLLGQWIEESANWVHFPDLASCFRARMTTLRRDAPKYSHYAAALAAKTGADFIREVSQTWSTDPQRAKKILEIYTARNAVFSSVTAIGLRTPTAAV